MCCLDGSTRSLLLNASIEKRPLYTKMSSWCFRQCAAVTTHLNDEIQSLASKSLIFFSVCLGKKSNFLGYLSLSKVPPHPITLLPLDPAVWKNTKDGNWSRLLKWPLIMRGWIENPWIWTSCSAAKPRSSQNIATEVNPPTPGFLPILLVVEHLLGLFNLVHNDKNGVIYAQTITVSVWLGNAFRGYVMELAGGIFFPNHSRMYWLLEFPTMTNPGHYSLEYSQAASKKTPNPIHSSKLRLEVDTRTTGDCWMRAKNYCDDWVKNMLRWRFIALA